MHSLSLDYLPLSREADISLYFFSWGILLLFPCNKGRAFITSMNMKDSPLKKGATLKKATDLDSVWCQLGDSTLNLHWLMINFSKHKAVWCKWRLQKKNDLSPFLAGIIPLLIPWEILHISWSGCLKIRSITPLVNNMKLPGIIFKGKRVVTTLIDLFSCIWTNVRASSARNCIDLANAKSGFLHCRMKWYSYSSVLSDLLRSSLKMLLISALLWASSAWFLQLYLFLDVSCVQLCVHVRFCFVSFFFPFIALFAASIIYFSHVLGPEKHPIASREILIHMTLRTVQKCLGIFVSSHILSLVFFFYWEGLKFSC